jgi:hypothetical protein
MSKFFVRNLNLKYKNKSQTITRQRSIKDCLVIFCQITDYKKKNKTITRIVYVYYIAALSCLEFVVYLYLRWATNPD